MHDTVAHFPLATRARSRLTAGVAVLALLAAACAPTAPAAPTTAPAKPTAASKPAPAVSPAAATSPVASKPGASPVASPVGKPGAQPAAKKGGTLRASTLGGAPKVLHPYPESQQYTTPWSDAATLIYSTLISIDYDKLDWGVTADDLAKGMPTVSPDGRTFTFTLRDDIKWSDGKPITSADFLFAWENASKKENAWIGLTSTVDRVQSFEAPDPKTVRVTLKETLARFLALDVVTGNVYPVPKHIWEGKPWSDPAGNPEVLKPTVVSGPYIPKEITAERHSYTRNPSYWGKQPNLDEIVFVNANPNTVLELLKTKQVEWSQSFPPAQFEDAKKVENARVVEWSGATGSYFVLQYNLKRPNLDNKKFREALSIALNRDDMVQLLDGLGVPQFGLYTQGSRWRNDGVPKYEFDLNKAKQLLTEAGYKLDGGVLKGPDGQPVKVDLLYPTTSQPRAKFATYMQQQWKQLGIETVVSGLEFNAFVDKYSRQKDFDIAVGAFSAGLDPDGVKSQLQTDGTQNASSYSNPRIDELLKQGAAEQDDAKRKQIYDEIQQVFMGDLAHYYIATFKNFTAFDKKVQGVRPLKGGDILRQNNLQVLDWSIQ